MPVDLRELPQPEGWTLELLYGNYVLIRAPRGGMVTLDPAARGFRGGLVTVGRMTSTRAYAGRCWLSALCADAITWLETIELAAGKPAKAKARRPR